MASYWRIVIRQSQVAGVTVLLRRRTGDWFAGQGAGDAA